MLHQTLLELFCGWQVLGNSVFLQRRSCVDGRNKALHPQLHWGLREVSTVTCVHTLWRAQQ